MALEFQNPLNDPARSRQFSPEFLSRWAGAGPAP